jgi:hypothetical protein
MEEGTILRMQAECMKELWMVEGTTYGSRVLKELWMEECTTDASIMVEGSADAKQVDGGGYKCC